MMTEEDFRALALSMPQTVEDSHFDVADFRVGGHIFATFRTQDGRAVVKLSPEEQILFREQAEALFTPVPGSWGEKGWTMIALEKIEPDLLRQAMHLAWRSVAPRALL
ncbi:MmcQ/YjbR family DNA-binding protein [Tianweitania populi]|uniref:MmcQ/YjbR family DNA-binding protein n=1 Tax=Tianweitania populi TaxID=1607949 RepID=A0A8J3DUY6_9HYPH|nr:MmcQ/YjbR family DNA-binding protein [Tianweitania populi]GHD15304.1 hypothetical protein GCM10016234_21970 [Tianweitania populi]